MPASLTVNRGDDYDPSGAPTANTLRAHIENASGDRDVTCSAGVIASGIDLGASYGPAVISNSQCDLAAGGTELRGWGITVAAPTVTIDNLRVTCNSGANGRGIAIVDTVAAPSIHDVSVSNVDIIAGGDEPLTVQQQYPGGSFSNISLSDIDIDAASVDAPSHGMLIAGPSAGQINGTFTYTSLRFGHTQPLAIRIPRVVGGLHTFTGCEFTQGWSTTDIVAAYVNFINCNWITRSRPGGATFWYAGRLVMVSKPRFTKLYFQNCTLNGAAATYSDLCKLWSVDRNDDIPASCVSGSLLTTLPPWIPEEATTNPVVGGYPANPYQGGDD